MAQLSDEIRSLAIGGAGSVRFLRAIVASLVATAAFTVVAYFGPIVGLPRADIATILGTMFVADPAAAFVPGLIMHFMIGGILALAYAFLFAQALPGQPWLRGAAYGLVPWLMAMVVVMPMLGLVHPMVLSGMMPNPGFFLLGMGSLLPALSSLVSHLVYGAVLGAIYGQPAQD